MSADPAMESYIPEASSNEGARERNQNLPGMGGVYNSRNLQTYHYAGNNPLKYVDPSGEEIITVLAVGLWSGFIFLIGRGMKATHEEKSNHEVIHAMGWGFVEGTLFVFSSPLNSALKAKLVSTSLVKSLAILRGITISEAADWLMWGGFLTINKIIKELENALELDPNNIQLQQQLQEAHDIRVDRINAINQEIQDIDERNKDIHEERQKAIASNNTSKIARLDREREQNNNRRKELQEELSRSESEE